MAVIRMLTAEESHFEDYKKIIKELLFNGADRKLKTKKGQTALELFLELNEDELEPSDYASIHRILSP